MWHLSNEDSTYSPSYIEMCTKVPLKWRHLSNEDSAYYASYSHRYVHTWSGIYVLHTAYITCTVELPSSATFIQAPSTLTSSVPAAYPFLEGTQLAAKREVLCLKSNSLTVQDRPSIALLTISALLRVSWFASAIRRCSLVFCGDREIKHHGNEHHTLQGKKYRVYFT